LDAVEQKNRSRWLKVKALREDKESQKKKKLVTWKFKKELR